MAESLLAKAQRQIDAERYCPGCRSEDRKDRRNIGTGYFGKVSCQHPWHDRLSEGVGLSGFERRPPGRAAGSLAESDLEEGTDD